MRTTLVLAIAAVAALAHPTGAQTPLPAGWHVHADAPAGGNHSPQAHATSSPASAATSAPAAALDGLSFVDMPPGWHITTGPSVILYNPERVASGRYSVRSESFLFDPGKRREAYGIFIGGARLDDPDQRYTYFLIRRSGEFLIKRRVGATVTALRDWTPHPAILQYDKRGDADTAKNVLGIDVTATDVAFLVNGTEVARLPRADVDAEGIVGLRVNHALNVHVSSLELTPAR